MSGRRIEIEEKKKKDIVCFDISVNNALRVDVFQRLQCLEEINTFAKHYIYLNNIIPERTQKLFQPHSFACLVGIDQEYQLNFHNPRIP